MTDDPHPAANTAAVRAGIKARMAVVAGPDIARLDSVVDGLDGQDLLTLVGLSATAIHAIVANRAALLDSFAAVDPDRAEADVRALEDDVDAAVAAAHTLPGFVVDGFPSEVGDIVLLGGRPGPADDEIDPPARVVIEMNADATRVGDPNHGWLVVATERWAQAMTFSGTELRTLLADAAPHLALGGDEAVPTLAALAARHAPHRLGPVEPVGVESPHSGVGGRGLGPVQRDTPGVGL